MSTNPENDDLISETKIYDADAVPQFLRQKGYGEDHITAVMALKDDIEGDVAVFVEECRMCDAGGGNKGMTCRSCWRPNGIDLICLPWSGCNGIG